MRKFLLGFLLGAVLMMPVGAFAVEALSQAWTIRKIHVPAYGYFAEHGYCRAEDMALAKVNYPGPNDHRFRCVHVEFD